jgi:hypothetical protein
MTDSPHALLRIELVVPPGLEALLDRAVKALDRIAVALERDAVAPETKVPAPVAGELHTRTPPLPKAPKTPAPVGSTVNVWTDERLRMLQREFTPDGDHESLLQRINDLPGREILNTVAMLVKAKQLGLGDGLQQAAPPPMESLIKWTPERLAILKEEWRAAETYALKYDLLKRINALPGDPIANTASMMSKVYSMAWHREAAPSVPAIAAPNVALPPPALSDKYSPERIAEIVRLRASEHSWEYVLQQVNQMPGEKIPSLDAIKTKYRDLKAMNKLPLLKATVVQAAPAPPVAVAPPIKAPPQPSTEELRRAKLKLMWERGDDVETILVAMNQMRGPIMTTPEIVRKAAACGFMRPPVSRPEAFEKGGPVTVAQLRAWFREAGGDPDVIPTTERLLKSANSLRLLMKLPPLEVAA